MNKNPVHFLDGPLEDRVRRLPQSWRYYRIEDKQATADLNKLDLQKLADLHGKEVKVNILVETIVYRITIEDGRRVGRLVDTENPGRGFRG